MQTEFKESSCSHSGNNHSAQKALLEQTLEGSRSDYLVGGDIFTSFFSSFSCLKLPTSEISEDINNYNSLNILM